MSVRLVYLKAFGSQTLTALKIGTSGKAGSSNQETFKPSMNNTLIVLLLSDYFPKKSWNLVNFTTPVNKWSFTSLHFTQSATQSNL